jgi:Fungal specific transcription factor domain/Fungal Zn(2)-Cys(6) binuclear cluster domain
MAERGLELSSKKERSHAGCTRCKRRRQKCDEKKPHCGRCRGAGAECEYSVKLRWGGRTFDRSRFGDCLKGSVRKTADSPDGFVYTASERALSVPQALPVFPTLSTTESGLLYHYTEEASGITCCGSHVQKELCSLVLPMAVESPALMNATVAWAAMHSVEFRGHIDGTSDPVRFIATLKARSIEHLRRELQKPEIDHGDALLATVRTLCQCEIHSGSDQSSAWRIHIKGAKALMDYLEKSNRPNRPRPRLLYRWYAAVDSLASLAACGSTAMIEAKGGSQIFSEDAEDVPYLDDYNGYSTDLSHIIGEIGAAVAAMRPGDSSSPEQADLLERAIFTIMERDNNGQPRFYPGVVERLTSQAIQEYSLCNQAYQQTALVYVRRQLRGLPRESSEIQDSVKRIIKCVRSITPSYGLSPAIVLTTPLFTAGCEALGEDRVTIRRLLGQLYELLKIRNIKLALEVLEASWADENVNGDLGTLLRMCPSSFGTMVYCELTHHYRSKKLEFHSLLRFITIFPHLLLRIYRFTFFTCLL